MVRKGCWASTNPEVNLLYCSRAVTLTGNVKLWTRSETTGSRDQAEHDESRDSSLKPVSNGYGNGSSNTSGVKVVTKKYLFDLMQGQNLPSFDEKLDYLENYLLVRYGGTFEIPIETTHRQGRPSKSFADLSERSKRRKTEEIRSSVDPEYKLNIAVRAVLAASQDQKLDNLAPIADKVMESVQQGSLPGERASVSNEQITAKNSELYTHLNKLKLEVAALREEVRSRPHEEPNNGVVFLKNNNITELARVGVLVECDEEGLPILEAACELLQELAHAVQEQRECRSGAGLRRSQWAAPQARQERVAGLEPLALHQRLEPGHGHSSIPHVHSNNPA
ncbi:unnamed protein product [Leptidea sinapis]|uniref:Uncharacterized protein n=1 Tax=Leptidea sinapis TaxID=189913 RepID=A0A5E4Q443_9NEOP|nr:unnamed protein product [Leptidea sinapis]